MAGEEENSRCCRRRANQEAELLTAEAVEDEMGRKVAEAATSNANRGNISTRGCRHAAEPTECQLRDDDGHLDDTALASWHWHGQSTTATTV